jgi:hypothetical protein
MAVAAVVFNGTRLNDSDANTGWGNFVVGGGAPASEFPLAYQVTSGTTTGAVNKKINSSAARQGVDYVGTAVDFTAAANRLWFCKIIVTDSFDLNSTWGVEVAMGSADTSNSHRYNIAGSGANLSVYDQYPAQGGYLITAIDPTIDTWAETADQGGAFDQTAVIWYAIGAQFINGTAKTENVAMDSIDYGTGLTITAGDGASTEGNFTDFVATDQDIKANRWGVVTGGGNIVVAHGMLTVGTTAVTEFLDTTSIVLFRDGYHSAGLVGVTVNNSHVNSILNIGCTIIGEGTRNGVAANDTRPDFIVNGTSGTCDISANLRNHRNITFQSDTDVVGADIECELLTQNSSNISQSIIRTNALASVACLQDPTFGTTTDLRDVEFIQTGAGHALELDTGGSVTLTDVIFTGYGAAASSDSAIWVTAVTDLTISIVGGSTPTIRNTGGATVTVETSVPLDWTVIDKDNNVISGAQITAFLVSDDSSIMTATDTNGSGVVSTSYGGTTPVDIYYRVRKSRSSTGSTKYKLFSAFGTISTSGLSATVTLIEDPNNNS